MVGIEALDPGRGRRFLACDYAGTRNGGSTTKNQTECSASQQPGGLVHHVVSWSRYYWHTLAPMVRAVAACPRFAHGEHQQSIQQIGLVAIW